MSTKRNASKAGRSRRAGAQRARRPPRSRKSRSRATRPRAAPARAPRRDRTGNGPASTLQPFPDTTPRRSTGTPVALSEPATARPPRPVCALILAAGMGKRMLSRTSKLVHPVAGRPMVRHVVEAASAAGVGRTVVVIGNQADEVRQAIGNHDKRVGFAFQKDQRGTGHAVLAAERQLQGHTGDVLILNGDLPTLSPATLRDFLAFHRASGAPLSLLTAEVADPRGYGRVMRNYAGDVARIVEENDATDEERATREINCGIYCVDAEHLCRPLKRATADNAQREIYLTDLVEILRRSGRKIAAYRHDRPSEVLGVNDRRELAVASRALYRRKADALMTEGVTIIDPDSTYVDSDVQVGRESILEPGVMLLGATTIGEDVRIGTGARIADSTIAAGSTIRPYCVIDACRIGRGCRIGPFAHLRPESVLEDESRVGNFVEVKKSRLGRGSKANHLTYLGDAEIGRGVNIGAGTITCNYDGVAKHRTIIEDEVFIGSGTELVAPVRIRRGAFIGAGSTITRDVPPHSLAVARGRQEIKEQWAKRFGPAGRSRPNGPRPRS